MLSTGVYHLRAQKGNLTTRSKYGLKTQVAGAR